jgi:hypothetical protein
MKACYDRLAILARFQEGDEVWLYHVTRTAGESPKQQSSWEGLYRVIYRIDMVCWIQRYSRTKMVVVHVDSLALYLVPNQDKQPQGGSNVT